MKSLLVWFMIGMNVAYALQPDDKIALQEYRDSLAPFDTVEIARTITNETAKTLPQQVDSISTLDCQ